MIQFWTLTLHRRHNECDVVSIAYSTVCSVADQKIVKDTGLCEGNSPLIGEFPSQKASNAEMVSIWLRHHDINSKISCHCRWIISY